MYNKLLVESYNEEDLLGMLSNMSLCQSLVDQRLNRYEKQTDLENLRLIDALDNLLMKYCTNGFPNLPANTIENYRQLLFNIYKENPLIVLDSELFKNDYAKKIFSEDQLKEINFYKNYLGSRVKSNAKAFLSGKKLTNYEKEELLRFSINLIDNPKLKNFHDNLFKKLLEDVNETKSNLEYEYILKYSAHLTTMDLNVPKSQIYIVNKLSEKVDFPKTTGGRNLSNAGVIAINRDLLTIPFDKNNKKNPLEQSPLVTYLHVIAHEVKHSKQYYNSHSTRMVKDGFEYIERDLFDKYLSTDEYSEYKLNYGYSEIENDAERYGWQFAVKTLEKYNPSAYQEIKDLTSISILRYYKESFGLKATEKDQEHKNRKPKYIYNVLQLDNILKHHPEELDKYPMLKTIYNPDGSRKKFDELLQVEQDVLSKDKNSDVDKILQDFYVVELAKGYLKKEDIASKDVEKQFLIFEKLSKIAFDEIRDLKNCMDALYKDSLLAFNAVNKDRIKKIAYILNYLMANKDVINKLSQIDVSQGNKRGFGMEFNYLQMQYDTLIKRIEQDDKLKSTDIYSDMMKLGDIKYGR